MSAAGDRYGHGDGDGVDERRVGSRSFPEGFLWGCGTSSYQIEGAVDQDGRGTSIWDVFSHTPGKVHRGDTGDIACDSYNRMEEDLQVLTELGIGAYRFSIDWARVQPLGSGAINQRGLDYYRALVDELCRREIMPVVTVYHWALPQALEDRGGWASRDTAERLGELAGLLAEALGDRVGMWVTINEPRQSAHQGYRVGTHAPGRIDDAAAAAATHHLLLGHGLALATLREVVPASAQLGVALDPHPFKAAEPEAEELALALDSAQNRMYLDPVLSGCYPSDAPPSHLPADELVHDGDMSLINAPLDFLGLNYYRPHYVRRGDWSDLRAGETPLLEHPGFVEFNPPTLPRTTMDWLIEPGELHRMLTRVTAQAPGLPIYITENGCAADDYLNPEGEINDYERVAFIRAHLEAGLDAIADGVNLRGYFHWSLMDNFEWAWGYQYRFGLYHVDFSTQRRTAKLSAAFFANVAAAGELPAAGGGGPGRLAPVVTEALGAPDRRIAVSWPAS